MIVEIIGGCVVAALGWIVLIGVKMQRPTIVGPTRTRDHDVEPVDASDKDMEILALRALKKRGIHQASAFNDYTEKAQVEAWANLDAQAVWAAEQPGKRWRQQLADWVLFYRRQLAERIKDYESRQRVNALEAQMK